MRTRYLLGLVGVLAVASVAVSTALASSGTGGATVKVKETVKFAINKYIQDGLRFVPGTVTVSSGSTLVFTYSDKEQDPHTLTIVPQAELPRTLAQLNGPCKPCRKYATPHLKNPHAPPGPGNPIIHWTLNQGQPGLDSVGDSLAIQPGAHKRNSAVVSAPAGTVLYFMCAVHPWMQGKIIVK
jgi:plastocyanin